MQDVIQYIAANWVSILGILTSVVGTAALIAAATPSTKDDAIVAKVKKVVDFLGANFGHAKNKD